MNEFSTTATATTDSTERPTEPSESPPEPRRAPVPARQRQHAVRIAQGKLADARAAFRSAVDAVELVRVSDGDRSQLPALIGAVHQAWIVQDAAAAELNAAEAALGVVR